jgi:hypothetical protein
MAGSVNIFYKIFQIMDHYENILDNYTHKGNKYKPDDSFKAFMNADEFFAFVAREISVNKRPAEAPPAPADPNKPTDNPAPPLEETPKPVSDTPNPDDDTPVSENEAVIKAYIKKCYKIIVLKCHPDKHSSRANNSAIFLKCQEYYNEYFLIGILYIFYLYEIKPPSPLNSSASIETDENSNILITRILKEIRVIQHKLDELNMPVKETDETEVPGPDVAPTPVKEKSD